MGKEEGRERYVTRRLFISPVRKTNRKIEKWPRAPPPDSLPRIKRNEQTNRALVCFGPMLQAFDICEKEGLPDERDTPPVRCVCVLQNKWACTVRVRFFFLLPLVIRYSLFPLHTVTVCSAMRIKYVLLSCQLSVIVASEK
jgi:hypothetical protein